MSLPRRSYGMPGRFLAVSRRVNHSLTPIVLRRQFYRVWVVEARHHNVPIVLDSIIGVHIVVVQRVGCDPHLFAVVCLLCRIAVRRDSVTVSLDCGAACKEV